MTGIIILLIIGLSVAGIVWWRRRRWPTLTAASSPASVPPATLALHAFARGNSCLAAGQLDEATAAFRQVLDIEPKHPHVAGRLAEVERRRQAMDAPPLASATTAPTTSARSA